MRSFTDHLAQYEPSRFSLEARLRRVAGLVALVGAAIVYGALIALYSTVYLVELAFPLVLLTFLVIWALPDARTGPVRLLKWLFFAFLIGLVVWPDYLALALPGLPWITVRRLISVPLLITLLICLSVSTQTRRDIAEVLRADTVVTRLLVAFIALQVFAVFISSDIGVSLDKLIVAQLYWSTVFFAGCYVFRDHGSIARWSAILCLILVPLCASGLLEWRNSQVPWAGHIPSFLAVEDEAVKRILTGTPRATTGTYRVQSTFSTPLGFAEYMVLATPFLIHYVVKPFRPIVRIAALLALPVVFFMLVLTDTRLGMAGFFLSFVLYVGMYAGHRWSQSRTSLFAPAIVLGYPAIFGMFIASTFLIGRLRRMVWGGGEHQASTEARQEQYAQGFQLLINNPFGYGIGRGAERLGFRNGADVLTIDTYYLLVALEYGVLGFFIYYSMLLWAGARASFRLFARSSADSEMHYLLPITISLANFVVIKSVFSVEANHPLVFMMLAMILALLAREPRQEGNGGRLRRAFS